MVSAVVDNMMIISSMMIIFALYVGFHMYNCLMLYVEKYNTHDSYMAIVLKDSMYMYLFLPLLAVKCFGVATSYLIVFGDLMPQVMMQVKHY